MKKSKLFSTLSAVGYGIFIVSGLVILITMAVLFFTSGDEGLSAALTKVVALLLGILGGAYALIGVIPLILRLISIKRKGILLPIFCLPFDLAYLVANAALLIALIVGESTIEWWGFAIFAALTALAIAVMTLNILTIVFRARDKRRARLVGAEELQITNETENKHEDQ